MMPKEAAQLPFPKPKPALSESELDTLETLLNRLAEDSFNQSRNNGFWDDCPDPLSRLCLIAGEAAGEAAEELRNGHPPAHRYHRESDGKPEGFPAELSDVIIRCCDASGRWNIPIGTALVEKLRFNRTRPFKHGKTT